MKLGGHPAVFLDVDTREFFLFGATFNAQDTWLLFFLLTGVGFGLVYATALAGRVWCGWACPQTVFLEGVYRRIERLVEGPREKRMRRNAGPWNVDKVARKVAAHALYVVASLLVAHIFLSYFASLPKTFAMVRQSPAAHPEAFAWVVAMTALFYGNFAWFREQLCVVLCPYGRLQSALLDEHSLVVGYDARRGEPRGKKGASGAGDCVDCKRCVVVCPTGIDIRNGTQMECLACTACIDACDDVMDRLGRPAGPRPLRLAGRARGQAAQGRPVAHRRSTRCSSSWAPSSPSSRRAERSDFEVGLLRLPGEPYTMEAGEVRNALQLHLVNKRSTAATYRMEVEPADGMTVVLPMPTVTLPPLSDVRVPGVPLGACERASTAISRFACASCAPTTRATRCRYRGRSSGQRRGDGRGRRDERHARRVGPAHGPPRQHALCRHVRRRRRDDLLRLTSRATSQACSRSCPTCSRTTRGASLRTRRQGRSRARSGQAWVRSGAVSHALLGLRFAAGALMIAVGFYLAGWGGALRWLERAGEPVWRRVAPLARRLVPVRTPWQALALGLVWGWMPCGLVYAALAASVTSGSPLAGATTMAAFGLGTLPTLVAMGSAAALVTRLARSRRVRIAAAVVVAAFGVAQIAHAGVAYAAAGQPACCAGHAVGEGNLQRRGP